MPVVVNKSSGSDKQPAKVKATGAGKGAGLSPVVVAVVIVVALALIGGAYYFFMGPSSGVQSVSSVEDPAAATSIGGGTATPATADPYTPKEGQDAAAVKEGGGPTPPGRSP